MSSSLVEVGAKAPEFTLPRDGGGSVSLADHAGKPVVLFFYPKASTPGCTTEARDFTALLGAFEAAGAVVLGVSKDSVKRQESFAAKQDLATALLSDAEGDVCERYGVWAEKMNYGKTYMGIVRSTFLIAPDGNVARVWTKVKVAGHAAEVLDAVRAL
jgi:thioredoxin-dependent peroxiredoxin